MSNTGNEASTGPDPPPRPLPGGRLVATVVQGHTFSIDRRYEPKKILGKGSFGVVCTAFDSVRRENIAIKRIRPYANDEWDARHTLREVRLMKVLGQHPNVITLYDLSLFDEKSELYMMMELMDCDLHRIIQSKQPLNDAHYKCFARQMLEGLKAMHAIGIFHRDLKPGNLLVSKDCQLRITDFGLARFMDEETLAGDNRQNPMTEYVVTRWYRCPELLLAPKEPYSCAIDLWSIGCIIGELIKRKPLFPGKSHANQVQLILEVRGYRGAEDLGFGLTQEAQSFLDRRCRYPGQPLSAFIPQASPSALELLEGLLQLNPGLRPTAAQALAMSYLADAQALHDYASPQCNLPPIPSSFFDFERKPYTLDVLRQMIRDEVKQSSPSRSAASDEAFPISSHTPVVDYHAVSPPQHSKGGVVRSTDPQHSSSDVSSSSATPATVSNRSHDIAEDGRFISTETAIDRASSQAVEAPYSQAPTAVRGLRRMSTGEMEDQAQKATQSALRSENAETSVAHVEDKQSKPKSSVVNPFQRVISKVIPSKESSSAKADEPHRPPKVALAAPSSDDGAERPSKRTPKTPSPGKMETIAKQERKQKRIFFLQSMQRQQMEASSALPSNASQGGVRETGIGFASSGSSGFLGMVNQRRRESSGGSSSSQQLGQMRTQQQSRVYPRPNVPPLAMQQQQQAAPAASGGSSSEIATLFSQFQSQSFSAREPSAYSSSSLAQRTSASRVPSTAPAAPGVAGAPASSSAGLGALKPSRFPSLGR